MWHDSRHQKKNSISPSTNGKHVLCIQEDNTQEITQNMYEPSMILKDHKVLLHPSFARTLSQLKMCDFSVETWSAIIFRVQWQHNCSLAASFANCVMTLYLLKVHLQTFLSIPITQKCQILSCDTIVTNERYYGIYVALVPCNNIYV
jgi:hypothetical protein